MMRFGLPESAIAKICAVFAAHPEIEQAVLYGSRAKGNFKPGTDIDLTLFGSDLSHELLLDLLVELDDLLLPWMIDLSLFASLNHPALQEHITGAGVLFYQRQE